MNKNIKLAVAGAVLALSASAANAGIVIPAGEWTLDVNGNVNAYANYTRADRTTGTAGSGGVYVAGGHAYEGQNNSSGVRQGVTPTRTTGINTGLLPAWIGFTGKTRQNDLDVEFTISMQPSVSENSYHGDGSNGTSGGAVNATFLNRQTYLSFGDKSWGSIKLGKDLGVFASDAILNDMTLLGVGAGAGNSGAAVNTTLGGIGTGYLYAAWKGQIAYTTPNFNGFQATVALTNPNMGFVAGTVNQDRLGFEGKASYSFSADNFSGKVWVSGASYDVNLSASSSVSTTISAGDIGATINANGFGLTGYYYTGSGAGRTALGLDGFTSAGVKRDSDGGYVQATYILPTKTKLGAAYGISNLDGLAADLSTNLVKENERITVGLYHPLTKHLNIVAEYNNVDSKAQNGNKAESQTYSAGAILNY